MKTIKVVISDYELVSFCFNNVLPINVQAGIYVFNKLRSAGVPVSFGCNGDIKVTSGVLKKQVMFDSCDTAFTWRNN